MKDYKVQKKYYKQMSVFCVWCQLFKPDLLQACRHIINFDMLRLVLVPAIKTLDFQIRITDG